MTVSSTSNMNAYSGNGSTTVFPITFQFESAATDIQVWLQDASGDSPYQITTGFQIDTANVQVDYPYPSGTTLPTGWKLFILRSTALTQGLDITNQGTFYAADIEGALDGLTLIAQDLQAQLDRVPQTAIGSEASYILPAATASTLLGWDSTGSYLENYESVPTGTYSAAAINQAIAATNGGGTIPGALAVTGALAAPGGVTGNVTGNVTGTAANVTGTVAIANGGTGVATTQNAYNAITAPYLPPSFRNKIINGDMRVAQRGTSQALTSSIVYGSIDRWTGYMPGAAGTLGQVAITDLPGFQYASKMQRTASSGSVTPLYTSQIVESVNAIPLQGQTVILSYWAKCGANFSASGNTLLLHISTGTATDQGSVNVGSWSNYVSAAHSTTLTTSWQLFTYTTTLQSLTSEISVNFSFTPVGTAGSDDSIYITGVQLEPGSVATPFEVLPYSTELALCQRYYQYYLGNVLSGYAPNVGNIFIDYFYPVPMRSSPTVVTNSPVYTNSSSLVNNTITSQFYRPQITATSTAYVYCVFNWVASAEL